MKPWAAISLGAASVALLTAAAVPSGTTVTVTVTDLRNAKGVVRACLTDDPRDFPDCKNEAHARRAITPAGKTVTLHFENVPPGKYAIALFHDENNNNKLDRALLMMPKEGYGFSRDAKVVMAPPKFAAAAFIVGSDPLSLAIRMRYML